MRSLYVLGVLLFAASAYANELGTIYDETETDPRNLFNNNTSLSVSFTSLIYGVFVLVALGLLAALLSYFLFGASAADTGYSSYSSYGGNSGYASGRAAELYMMSHMSMVVLLCGLAHSVTGQDFEDGASARFGYSSTNSDNLDNVALDAPSLFLSLAAIAFAVGLFPLIYVFFSDLINATFASKFGDTHGYSRSDSISAGQEYIDQASMYSKMFPVGIFVQMVFGAMMVKTSTQAGYISLGKPSLVKKQSFDYNLLPSSAHAFISAPSYIVPLSSLQKVDNTQSVDQQNFDSAAYSNAQQINPYISSYTSYAQIETTSESPRLFSNFANGLSSGGLFYCPPGDGSCLIQRVMGSIFVLAGLSVGGFLVYSLLTGGLGNVQDFGRSASPYATVFDKLSVLDWIAMMEEVYRKFDATSVDCQKRLVCELHQNENTWGSTARKMNDAFGYLQYFELLNLPEDLRMMLEEYLEAANKGRTSQNSCEELFPTCEFSMKSLISKYNGSNSI